MHGDKDELAGAQYQLQDGEQHGGKDVRFVLRDISTSEMHKWEQSNQDLYFQLYLQVKTKSVKRSKKVGNKRLIAVVKFVKWAGREENATAVKTESVSFAWQRVSDSVGLAARLAQRHVSEKVNAEKAWTASMNKKT